MTALVFAGGGTRGAVQIGMLQVLAEHGFVPDRIYGASVGAVNGAGFASDPTPAGRRADDPHLDGAQPGGRLSRRAGSTDRGSTSSSGTPSTRTAASARSSRRG